MNSEELRILIETARIKKGISQRELSKQTGISRSTLNDLINGKIKKVDIDDLRKIAEALDMSLQELVKVAGYDEMSMYFRMNKSQDKYLDKSTKDLKRLLDEYKNSEIELLRFDAKKRDRAVDAGSLVVKVAEYLKMMKTRDDILYTMDNAIEDLERAAEILKDVYQKYDYSKLPRKD